MGLPSTTTELPYLTPRFSGSTTLYRQGNRVYTIGYKGGGFGCYVLYTDNPNDDEPDWTVMPEIPYGNAMELTYDVAQDAIYIVNYTVSTSYNTTVRLLRVTNAFSDTPVLSDGEVILAAQSSRGYSMCRIITIGEDSVWIAFRMRTALGYTVQVQRRDTSAWPTTHVATFETVGLSSDARAQPLRPCYTSEDDGLWITAVNPTSDYRIEIFKIDRDLNTPTTARLFEAAIDPALLINDVQNCDVMGAYNTIACGVQGLGPIAGTQVGRLDGQGYNVMNDEHSPLETDTVGPAHSVCLGVDTATAAWYATAIRQFDINTLIGVPQMFTFDIAGIRGGADIAQDYDPVAAGAGAYISKIAPFNANGMMNCEWGMSPGSLRRFRTHTFGYEPSTSIVEARTAEAQASDALESEAVLSEV